MLDGIKSMPSCRSSSFTAVSVTALYEVNDVELGFGSFLQLMEKSMIKERRQTTNSDVSFFL